MNKEILDVVLLITQILILITLAVYVIKTWRISSATQSAADVFALSLQVIKEARDQEIAPYVVAYFDVPHGEEILYLIVKNIGKSTARDVRLQFKPKLIGNSGEDISELPVMKDGIAALPPNHELKIFVDFTTAFFFEKSDRPLTYEITVTFYGGLKDTQRVSEHVLDLTAYKRISKFIQRGSRDLLREVEKISKSIDRMSKDLSELNDNLSGGLQLRNPITSASLQSDSESWHQVISSKLLEFKHLWSTLYGGNPEKLVQPFLGKLKNRLNHITDQVLITSSLCPPNTGDEIKNKILDIVAKLADLNSLQISSDDFRSITEFNSNGNKILISIEDVITKITKANQEHRT